MDLPKKPEQSRSRGAEAGAHGPRENRSNDSQPLQELELSMQLLSAIRKEVARDVEKDLEGTWSDSLYQRVVERLHKSQDVERLVAAEMSRRTKVILGALGAIATLLGILGLQTIGPVVESRATDAARSEVQASFSQQREELRELRKSITEAQVSLADHETTAATRLNSTISAELRAAERELKGIVDDASKRLGTDVTSYAQRLEKQSLEAEVDLERSWTRIRSELTAIAERAQKNLQATRDEALTAIGQKRVTSEPRDPFGLVPDPEAPEIESPGNLAGYLDVITVIADRNLGDALNVGRGLATAGQFEIAAPLLKIVLENPDVFDMSDMAEAARLLVDSRRDRIERASDATEVLVAAARLRSEELFQIAQTEFEENVFARLADDAFEGFARGVYAAESQVQLNTLFDAIDPQDLTGIGLVNTLYLAKLGGLDRQRIEDAERRLLNNLRTESTIDRSTDYVHVYMAARALSAAPIFDVAGIREAAALMRGHVLSGEDALNDPWGVGPMLDRLESAVP